MKIVEEEVNLAIAAHEERLRTLRGRSTEIDALLVILAKSDWPKPDIHVDLGRYSIALTWASEGLYRLDTDATSKGFHIEVHGDGASRFDTLRNAASVAQVLNRWRTDVREEIAEAEKARASLPPAPKAGGSDGVPML